MEPRCRIPYAIHLQAIREHAAYRMGGIIYRSCRDLPSRRTRAWSDISEARVLVECALPDFRVDPSQGTHFFQNLTSFNAGYVNVDPYSRRGDAMDLSALDALPAVYETPWLRHVRLDAPLTVCVDGREGRAVIKL